MKKNKEKGNAMANKVAKYKGNENKPMAEANAQRAFSGAWGTHADKRTKRNRTRLASKKRAIREFV